VRNRRPTQLKPDQAQSVCINLYPHTLFRGTSWDPGPATFEITNNPTSTEPSIIESPDHLDEREENDGLTVGSILDSLVDGSGRISESDLSAITHDNRLAILDKYFPKSATGSGPLSGVLVPEPTTPPARVTFPSSSGIRNAPSTDC
jgi:hypothetical protein